MERDGHYSIDVTEPFFGGNKVPQHRGKIPPRLDVRAVLEYLRDILVRRVVSVENQRRGIAINLPSFRIGAQTGFCIELVRHRIVLHLPEMGQRQILTATYADMFFKKIELPSADDAYPRQRKVKNASERGRDRQHDIAPQQLMTCPLT